MSDPREVRSEAERWLAVASTDLVAAGRLLNQAGQLSAQTCFFAQQAAEKAIKALLVRDQIEFPFIHDLDALLGLLPRNYANTKGLASLSSLTRWAVLSRYPNAYSQPTSETAEEAVSLAMTVLRAVEEDWRNSSPADGDLAG